MIDACAKRNVFAASLFLPACLHHPDSTPDRSNAPITREDSAYYPAKFRQRVWMRRSVLREHLLSLTANGRDVRVARYHNISGQKAPGRRHGKGPAGGMPQGSRSARGGEWIWGDGEQTRSFRFIDECSKVHPAVAVRRPVRSISAPRRMVSVQPAGAHGHGHRRQRG